MRGNIEVSSTDVLAVAVIVPMLGLCFLVTVCLRGTAPAQRPSILRALGEALRSLWPGANASRVGTQAAAQVQPPEGPDEG